MRPTPTRLDRWDRVLTRSRAPLAKVIQDVQAVVIAAKGGRLTFASNLLRDLRAIQKAYDDAERALVELGAHEDRKVNR